MIEKKAGLRSVLAISCVSFALVASGCAVRSHGSSPAHGPWLTRVSAGKQGPSNWFLNQRRSVDGALPARALARAVEQTRLEESTSLAPGSWVNAGPINVGGRVTALAADPGDPNRLWVGTAAGGVLTSTNGGIDWNPVFDGQTALSIGSVATHPTNSGTVFVGTGEDNGGGFSYDGEGVFRTTDSGATWTNLGLAETRRIGKIVVDRTNPLRILVAAGGDWFRKNTDRGIYRSTDGGASWQKVLYVADDAGGIDLAIDPSDPNRIFAAVWQRFSFGTGWYIGGPNSGIWRSLDGGTTWSKLTSGLPAAPGRIGIAIAPSSPQTVYACIVGEQGLLDGIYRSNDRGDTWSKTSGAGVPNQFSTFSYYFSQIRVDPGNANTVYALDVNLLRSTNGGQSFSSIAPSVHVDWHDLILEPGGRWLAGTDGGFYRSGDGGGTWFKSLRLPITQLYDLGISQLEPARRFAGAQDNATLRTATGGTSDWRSVLGGDGLQCEVDPTDPAVVYAEYQWGGINRSVNGGESFSPATSGIDPADRNNWNTPITLDPVVPSTLYTGTQRVYRSTDRALSWVPISGDLSNGHPFHADGTGAISGEEGANLAHLQNLADGTITVVNVSSVNPGILWAGTDDGNVWVSDDAGAAWRKVNPAGPPYWVTDIEPSRFDAATAFLTVTGYRSGDRLPYVRVTRDLGGTWQDISAGLPQVPVSTVLPSSEWRGRVFVGNDVGVFLSDNDGLTWSEMRGGMPYVVVMDLEEHAPSGALFAATHARSIFTYDLAQLPPADGDGDGSDNHTDCAPLDGGAFAPPPEVPALVLQLGGQRLGETSADDSVAISWPSVAAQAGAATVYDLSRGSLASLPVAGVAGAISLACGISSNSFVDTAPLPAGQGVYYLARARNACGLGSWGTSSGGQERPVPSCP